MQKQSIVYPIDDTLLPLVEAIPLIEAVSNFDESSAMMASPVQTLNETLEAEPRSSLWAGKKAFCFSGHSHFHPRGYDLYRVQIDMFLCPVLVSDLRSTTEQLEDLSEQLITSAFKLGDIKAECSEWVYQK